MAGTAKTRTQLTTEFTTGKIVTQQNFEDFFASYLSFEETDINTLSEKVTPANDDVFIIEDSADSYAKKKVKLSAIGGGGFTGETNTLAMHPSATGSSVVETKSGTELRVKGLKSSTGKITFSTSGNDLDLGVSLAASDVSLGNVTNHAQLRTTAGYFSNLLYKIGNASVVWAA